ncbi:cadherin-like beta sandwich domain-containing protein, partial [Rhizobium johnstonii]|uniref:cadherin-like beta sandwich domain-containing protein n=1 Tax=Rhizobium johnstonii TaxID=3019933 RepID=UPI003F97E4A1
MTATPDSSHVSGITVDGTSVNLGEASGPIELLEGGNEITIVVTSENGTMATYVLDVVRASLSADATLSALAIG